MSARTGSLQMHGRRALLAAGLLVAGVLVARPGHAQAPAGAPQEGWARYEVPMVEGAEGPCCHEIRDDVVLRRGCTLDHRGGMVIRGLDDAAAPASDRLAVYLHFSDGAVDRVRAFGGSCPVTADTPPAALSVQPAASQDLLLRLARAGGKPADEAVMALAHHAGDSATADLAALAGDGEPRGLRKDAVFWLGQLRGADGAAVVERIARGDADPKLREHAVFSLSQAPGVDGFATIADIARKDASARVRGQALFWMAQTGDPRAAGAILRALREDGSGDVREEAVFALSQLDEGGDAALIGIVRGDHPREVKKKALFWLGQSGSDEAIAFLDSVLANP